MPPPPDTNCSFLTSKEREGETGLDYFGARYYGSHQGRFTGVDACPVNPTDPHSWNRYVYVQNNPLKFVDPTGLSLTLTGAHAEDLVDELESATGLQLTRDAKTGVVTIDKGSKRNKKVGSSDLAKVVEKIIKDKKVDVAINVDKNQPGITIDSYNTRELDLADVLDFKAADIALGTMALGHVLGEYYLANQKGYGAADFLKAHAGGLEAERKVLSNFTGKKEQTRDEQHPNPSTLRIVFTTVYYDIVRKAGISGHIDTVDRITKNKTTKPGVP